MYAAVRPVRFGGRAHFYIDPPAPAVRLNRQRNRRLRLVIRHKHQFGILFTDGEASRRAVLFLFQRPVVLQAVRQRVPVQRERDGLQDSLGRLHFGHSFRPVRERGIVHNQLDKLPLRIRVQRHLRVAVQHRLLTHLRRPVDFLRHILFRRRLRHELHQIVIIRRQIREVLDDRHLHRRFQQNRQPIDQLFVRQRERTHLYRRVTAFELLRHRVNRHGRLIFRQAALHLRKVNRRKAIQHFFRLHVFREEGIFEYLRHHCAHLSHLRNLLRVVPRGYRLVDDFRRKTALAELLAVHQLPEMLHVLVEVQIQRLAQQVTADIDIRAAELHGIIDNRLVVQRHLIGG